jgi:hypothetical protein
VLDEAVVSIDHGTRKQVAVRSAFRHEGVSQQEGAAVAGIADALAAATEAGDEGGMKGIGKKDGQINARTAELKANRVRALGPWAVTVEKEQAVNERCSFEDARDIRLENADQVSGGEVPA